MIFAIIENGIVQNVITADAWPEGIDVTDVTPRPAPGWLYDGAVFSPPAPIAQDPEPVRIPRDDFIERFGLKWLPATEAAKTDAQLSLALAVLMGKQDGMVTITSPRVGLALGYMVSIGLLTQAEAAAIGAY